MKICAECGKPLPATAHRNTKYHPECKTALDKRRRKEINRRAAKRSLEERIAVQTSTKTKIDPYYLRRGEIRHLGSSSIA